MSYRKIPPTPKRGMRALAIIVTIGLVTAGLVVFALPAFLASLVGLLPTMATLVADRTPGYRASRCVGVTNIAGVLPIVAMSFNGDTSMDAAITLLVDPINWLVMYVGAGMGWVLLWIGPVIAEVFVTQKAASEVRSLRENQRKLIAEWGRKVLDA